MDSGLEPREVPEETTGTPAEPVERPAEPVETPAEPAETPAAPAEAPAAPAETPAAPVTRPAAPAQPAETAAEPGKWVSVVVKRPRMAPDERLVSLDALRGFDMFWIVGGHAIMMGLGKALNNDWFNQHIMPQLQHVQWEGFTAWDLIMPLFLFVVGVAMPFSFAKRFARGDSRARLYCHVICRVIVLWILGMIAQGRLLDYDVSQLRFYSNTLQSIAAGYLFASILLVNLRPPLQFGVTAGLLLLFWALLMLVPVPGAGVGQLTADGNLAIYLDKLILGPYQDGTTYTWILSSMTFTATVMIGAFAGQLLRSRLGKIRKLLFLLAAGTVCVYLGGAWGRIFPIIKHIWTSSMVLYAGGWSLLLLAAFYLVMDVLRLRFLGLFFVVIGMNAIAVYMITRVFDFRALGDIVVHGLAQWTGDWHDFTRAVAGFVILWLILCYMYRKKTFIKI